MSRERKYRVRYHQKAQGSIPEQIIERIYTFEELLQHGKPHPIETIISVDDWTGLKDKNGKDIYEWDIVTDGNEKGNVFWDSDSACYLVDFVFSDFEPQEIHQSTMWAEVTGNIHEEQSKPTP